MPRVMVDPTGLAGWSTDASAARTRLALSLGEVDTAIAAMSASWEGEAARRFDGHYRRWRDAAGALLGTLTELVALVEGARANYTAASAANQQIWKATAPSTAGPAVVTAMSAAAPAVRIDVEPDDVRVAVSTLSGAAERLVEAWQQLSQATAAATAMAGDDEFGAAFGRDHDQMAVAAWQGWRASAIMLTSIAMGLAETGNNVLNAEHRSTAGASGASPRIVARPVPVPAPPVPPSATGPNGSSAPGPLAQYWPAADPDLLRAAAAAWRTAAPVLREASVTANTAMSALVGADADPTLDMARQFTARALSADPTTGLCGLLDQHCQQIAYGCELLADATIRTRLALRDAIVDLFATDEWYHPVGQILDALITRGWSKFVSRGGDILELFLALGQIRDRHEEAVQPALTVVSPAAAARMTRLATSFVPPDLVMACAQAVTAPAGTPEAERRELLAQVAAAGHKIDPNETLHIVRAPDGRIVWLEKGNGRSGLSHMLRAERIAQFAGRGVRPEEVSTLAPRAITEGTRLGPVRDGGVAYDVPFGDSRIDIVVVVGSNGYIVTAYPLESRSKLAQETPT
ncbi:MAG: WXG100 family type VII secretion target [Pseudonocardia sp.]|nr:WXG100 family type VII secretion target [Pseudonocardia sp.]